MNFAQRLRFYLVGVIFGCLFVYVLFGNREYSCAYFPNARVLDEAHNKPKVYTATCLAQLKKMNLDTSFIQKNIFTSSKIDFDKSQPRAKPCGKYIAYYPKKNPIYIIEFQKCEKKVLVNSIEKYLVVK
jgi:hypothetical protein